VVTDQGLQGYGYADLFPRTGETIATAQAIIEEVLAPGLKGREPFQVRVLVAWMERRVRGNSRAKGAVEMALQDLRGKATGLPIYELLGGKVRESVAVMRMVGLRSPKEMAEEGSRMVRQGFKALKLKIGTGWKEDLERVRQVRLAVGENIYLKVDANEAYTPLEALSLARHLEELQVGTFEQPLPAEDWEGMIHLTKNSPIAIEADQTVRSVSDALRAIRLGAAHVINTSPQKVGGIHQAKQIADLCEAAGIPCIVSNVASSLINDAAAIHVIAASLATHLPCEVGEFQRITGDPARGLEIQNGEIPVPTSPGLGIEIESFP